MLPPRSSVVIEELSSSSMIPEKGLLLKYHKPSSTPHVTPSPTTHVNPTPTSINTTFVTPSSTSSHSPNANPFLSKRKFTKSSVNRIKTNVNDIEPVPLHANVNVQDPEPLPANANTNVNKTIEYIVQELMSMNYEFDQFENNINAQPSVNEQERARDDINEPEETLVEGETVAEDEEDSSIEEGDSDSEDDEDYFVDKDTYLEEVNVDMADYHFNIDAEVEWVRHSSSGQEQDHDPIPGELDVIDNDNFESGTDSKDDGIVKIRRKKLREIKKANESDDNIKEAVLGKKNDKLRIRAKCLGRIPVFTLDGEGPSNTEEVAPTKKTTKVKGKKDVGLSDPVGPNKKGRAKSDILLNNLCECFNGKILDARDAPIITALKYIREYLMRRMVNVITVIKKTDGPLTPSATKLLKVAMDKANKYTVGFNGGKSIPCAHAIVTNYNMALNGIQVALPEESVDKCYWLATWKHAYSYTLGCLNVGRPKKNRRKTKEEKAQMVKDGKLSRAYKTVTCNKCGNLGHNSRSCKGQKDPMNATGTSTSQRSTNAAAGTRKRPSDASTTPLISPTKKKHATRSSNAGTTPSTASVKKKQAATGSGQNRMTRAGSAAAKMQKKNESTII
ncbi:ribonuclease H-like domain-containing protein [Tanacetum coccineum]